MMDTRTSHYSDPYVSMNLVTPRNNQEKEKKKLFDFFNKGQSGAKKKHSSE